MLDPQTAMKFHEGDLEALRVIAEQFQGRLFGLGLRLFGQPATAGDFCQDVFIRAFEKRRLYNPRRPFDPWFFKVAVNLGRQQLRRKREILADEDLPDQAVAAEAEHHMIKQEQQARVWAALRKVPEIFRETLGLRFASDLSLKEIAQAMGISLGTVKSRLSRGLVSFEKAYQAGGDRE